MNLKKLLALGLALILVLALAACSNSDGGDSKYETANAGTLTMATNAAVPPYEYYEGNEIVGIDAEIAAAVAEKLGLELKIEDMEFDSIIPAIQQGRVDIGLAGITVNAEREEEVNFTVKYATGKQVIIVREDDETIAGGNDDLQIVDAEGNVISGLTIGVQRNTTGDLYCTDYMEAEGLATMDRYSRGADAVQALLTGKVDCVVIDNEPAESFVAANEGLKIVEGQYVEEQYAGAMSKDNQELYEAVDAALQEMIDDGTIQGIIDKYITD